MSRPSKRMAPCAGLQPQQGEAEGGLAAAALADQADRLALVDGQADAVHRLHEAHGAAEQAAADREVHLDSARHRRSARRRPVPARGGLAVRSPAACGCRGAAGRRRSLAVAPCSTASPSFITTTRSAWRRTICRSWVISSIAMPRRRLRSCQQLQDLRLDGDVERGGRLVGDQQLRGRWPAPRRSSPAGAGRRKAGAGRR